MSCIIPPGWILTFPLTLSTLTLFFSLLFRPYEQRGIPPFISTAPSHLQGPHQTRWQPQPAWRWGSFSSSNRTQRVPGASWLLVLSHRGSPIHHRHYKERLDRVRGNQHHSINPCDYPRLRGVWAMCLPARGLSTRTFVSGISEWARLDDSVYVHACRQPRCSDTCNMCQSQGLVPLVAGDNNIIPACPDLLPSLHHTSLFAAPPSLPLSLCHAA